MMISASGGNAEDADGGVDLERREEAFGDSDLRILLVKMVLQATKWDIAKERVQTEQRREGTGQERRVSWGKKDGAGRRVYR